MGNPIARTNSLGMSILVASYLHSYPYSLESYITLVFYTTARNDPQIIGHGRRVAGSKKERKV